MHPRSPLSTATFLVGALNFGEISGAHAVPDQISHDQSLRTQAALILQTGYKPLTTALTTIC